MEIRKTERFKRCSVFLLLVSIRLKRCTFSALTLVLIFLHELKDFH